MTCIRIDLSSPEALQRFRDLAKAMLELTDEATPKLRATLEKKAQEMGVHPADFETIAAELQIPKTFVQPQAPPVSPNQGAISDTHSDNDLNDTECILSPIEQFNLAEKYYDGKDVEKDYPRAAKLYRMAAESGHAQAQYKLGFIYKEGRGIEQDDEKAFEWYQKAAEQGYAEAQYKLGDMYRHDDCVDTYEIGFDWWTSKAPLKAFEWYQKAAEQGNISAQYSLGYMYEKGEGVAADNNKAIEWNKRAAAQIKASADRLKGNIEWVTKDAKKGDVWMQVALGHFYETGTWVEQDHKTAIKWYEKAAAQGNIEAQYQLGRIYRSGERGVARGYEKADEWYKKAAAQGNAAAMYNHGRLDEFGDALFISIGKERDYKTAIEWYEKAAAHGSKLAQKRLKIRFVNRIYGLV